MSASILYFGLGFITGAISIILGAAVCSGYNFKARREDRRASSIDRRRRLKTTAAIKDVERMYSSGAITYPQASHRLREREVAQDVIKRVLAK